MTFYTFTFIHVYIIKRKLIDAIYSDRIITAISCYQYRFVEKDVIFFGMSLFLNNFLKLTLIVINEYFMSYLNDFLNHKDIIIKMRLFYLTAVPNEVAVFLQEHLNNWYSLRSYYIVKILTDFPMQVCFDIFISNLSVIFISNL